MNDKEDALRPVEIDSQGDVVVHLECFQTGESIVAALEHACIGKVNYELNYAFFHGQKLLASRLAEQGNCLLKFHVMNFREETLKVIEDFVRKCPIFFVGWGFDFTMDCAFDLDNAEAEVSN